MAAAGGRRSSRIAVRAQGRSRVLPGRMADRSILRRGRARRSRPATRRPDGPAPVSGFSCRPASLMIVKRTLWSPAMTTNRSSSVAAPPEPFDLYDQGLQADVATLVDRRRVLQLMGLAGVGAFLAACAPGAVSSATATASASAPPPLRPPPAPRPAPRSSPRRPPARSRATARTAPTSSPQSGVVRSDIRVELRCVDGTAEGVPLTIRLTIQDAGNGCAPLAERRGLRLALRPRGQLLALLPGRRRTRTTCAASRRPATTGSSTFTSIFPACYSGRWPHIHFEVYPTSPPRRTPANRIATSQIALPKDICEEVYATDGLRAERAEPAAGQPHSRHGLRRRRRGAPAGHDLAARSPTA